MDALSWKKFFDVLCFVVVFAVPVILYLMEKAGTSLAWIFVVGWVSIAAAALYLFLSIPWVWADAPIAVRIWRISLMTAIALLGVGYGAIKIWPHSAPVLTSETPMSKSAASNAGTVQPERPPTLRDLFNSDFPNVMKFTDASCEVQWERGGKNQFMCQVYLDFPAKSQFVGYYVPSSVRTYDVCIVLANGVWDTINNTQKRVAVSAGYRDEQNKLSDLVFTGRVLLYHEDFLTIPQKAAIIEVFKAKGFDVNFRGPDYLGDQVIAWRHKYDPKPQQ